MMIISHVSNIIQPHYISFAKSVQVVGKHSSYYTTEVLHYNNNSKKLRGKFIRNKIRMCEKSRPGVEI